MRRQHDAAALCADPPLMTAALSRYNPAMPRFAASQPDLFAPAPAPATQGPPARSPLDELNELLAQLRVADRSPWPDLPAAMAAEYRVLGLARLAGNEGARLATAILDETERLFAAAEQEAAQAAGLRRPV
jgi:hypothetical protein